MTSTTRLTAPGCLSALAIAATAVAMGDGAAAAAAAAAPGQPEPAARPRPPPIGPSANMSKAEVVAFYGEDAAVKGHPEDTCTPSFWLDFPPDTVTTIIMQGTAVRPRPATSPCTTASCHVRAVKG
eukprot:SAG22_NODE_191_length_15699_cov_19.660192_7_plen_126_part_00